MILTGWSVLRLYTEGITDIIAPFYKGLDIDRHLGVSRYSPRQNSKQYYFLPNEYDITIKIGH